VNFTSIEKKMNQLLLSMLEEKEKLCSNRDQLIKPNGRDEYDDDRNHQRDDLSNDHHRRNVNQDTGEAIDFKGTVVLGSEKSLVQHSKLVFQDVAAVSWIIPHQLLHQVINRRRSSAGNVCHAGQIHFDHPVASYKNIVIKDRVHFNISTKSRLKTLPVKYQPIKKDTIR